METDILVLIGFKENFEVFGLHADINNIYIYINKYSAAIKWTIMSHLIRERLNVQFIQLYYWTFKCCDQVLIC